MYFFLAASLSFQQPAFQPFLPSEISNLVVIDSIVLWKPLLNKILNNF